MMTWNLSTGVAGCQADGLAQIDILTTEQLFKILLDTLRLPWNINKLIDLVDTTPPSAKLELIAGDLKLSHISLFANGLCQPEMAQSGKIPLFAPRKHMDPPSQSAPTSTRT
jgi:hypothetical protein